MASIFSLATRMFRTRNVARDASTDRARIAPVEAALRQAIESAQRERNGLKQRIDDYYARASYLLDQSAEYGQRSQEEEDAIAEAERSGAAGLHRVSAIDVQLERLGRMLQLARDERDEVAAA